MTSLLNIASPSARRKATRVQLSLLVWASVTVFLAAAKPITYVTSPSELVSALRDPNIITIALGSGIYNLDTLSASTAADGGLVIGPNRQVEIVGNVSILGASEKGAEGWLQTPALRYASSLDFGANAAGLFRLGDNTTLGFRDLILVRGLSQLGYDWQVANLSRLNARASVRFTRTIKLREACLPLQIFLQHITSYPRLDDSPGQQAAALQPLCYQAPAGYGASIGLGLLNASSAGPATLVASNDTVCTPEVLAVSDLATLITRSNGLSYSLYEQNSSYWCRAYASMSCLSAAGPEQCVNALLAASPPPPGPTVGTPNGTASGGAGGGTANITKGPPPPPLLNQGLGSAPGGSSSGGGGGNSGTNVILPAVLTGVLALASVFGLLYCMRRRGDAKGGASLGAAEIPGAGGDMEQGGGGGGAGGAGGRVGDALARLLPRGVRGAQQRKPHVPGYVPVVSKEALDKIIKVRAELSSKMVVSGSSSADDLSDVRNLHLVGKGTFGRVYKGEWKGVTVALKVISVPVSQYGQAQWQAVLGEAAIATLLNHPCVLQTYSVALLEFAPACRTAGSASDDAGGNSAGLATVGGGGGGGGDNSGALSSGGAEMAPFYQLKMVSEYCEGGSVVNALHRLKFYDSTGGGAVRLPAVLDIAAQVASGMAYLHSANIIHADLKATNVLLKQQPGSGRLGAKVADFGLSFRMEEPEATHVTKGQLGSITHMAPEVLLHGRVSKSSDVYSFGILLYELYTGQQAYLDVPPPMLAYHVATAGGRPPLPPHCPPAYRAVARACWSPDAAARPTFQEIYTRLQALADAAQKGHQPSAAPSPSPSPSPPQPAAPPVAAAAAPATAMTPGAPPASPAAAPPAAAAILDFQPVTLSQAAAAVAAAAACTRVQQAGLLSTRAGDEQEEEEDATGAAEVGILTEMTTQQELSAATPSVAAVVVLSEGRGVLAEGTAPVSVWTAPLPSRAGGR